MCNCKDLLYDISEAQKDVAFEINGKLTTRIKAQDDCSECHVLAGQFHVPGCKKEICPVCSESLISCNCVCNYLEKRLPNIHLERIKSLLENFLIPDPDNKENLHYIGLLEKEINSYKKQLAGEQNSSDYIKVRTLLKLLEKEDPADDVIIKYGKNFYSPLEEIRKSIYSPDCMNNGYAGEDAEEGTPCIVLIPRHFN